MLVMIFRYIYDKFDAHRVFKNIKYCMLYTHTTFKQALSYLKILIVNKDIDLNKNFQIIFDKLTPITRNINELFDKPYT